MKCPGFEKLIDYLDGRLKTEAAGLVTSHLASGCERCAADRQWYETVKAVAAGDDSVEPPPWVLKRALNLFDGERRPTLGERIGQAIAKLVFDSMARPAMVGVRSTEMANRQLMYSAGDYNIDVQVMTTDQPQADVIGQVLRKSELRFESVAGLPLDLKCEGALVTSTVTNDLGEFVFSGVFYGQYDLEVKIPEGNISIVGLPVTLEN